MSVILFYSVLIGGLSLVAALYLAALLLPIGLIGHRFGWIAGAVFAAVMAIVLWVFFEPPFNGVRLDSISRRRACGRASIWSAWSRSRPWQ